MSDSRLISPARKAATFKVRMEAETAAAVALLTGLHARHGGRLHTQNDLGGYVSLELERLGRLSISVFTDGHGGLDWIIHVGQTTCSGLTLREYADMARRWAAFLTDAESVLPVEKLKTA